MHRQFAQTSALPKKRGVFAFLVRTALRLALHGCDRATAALPKERGVWTRHRFASPGHATPFHDTPHCRPRFPVRGVCGQSLQGFA
jgi:hypothetical protein